MRVILQKPVDKLGVPGDVIEVADGYARNYLMPRGLAIKAHKGAAEQAENLRRAHERRQYARKGEYEAIASKLISGGPVVVKARAGEEGKLFGSVTAEQIAAAVAAQADVTVDKRDVHLEEPIRSIGAHEVKVHLFYEVEPVLTVEVVPEG
jgi:large subunit ribosomal protein L9